MAEPPASAHPAELELARAQCRALHDRLAASPSLPRHPALRSLLRLVAAELRFLNSTNHPDPARPLSSNLPHLGALHLLLTHPAVRSPSRLAPLPGVDFACAFRSRPAWVLLFGRNPSGFRWVPRKGLRSRVAAVLDAARSAQPATRPEKLLLAFARGVSADIVWGDPDPLTLGYKVREKQEQSQEDPDPVWGLADEFRAVEIDLLAEFVGETEDAKEEDGWVSVSFDPGEEMRSFRAFEIDIVDGGGEVLSPPPPQDVKLEVGSDDTLEGCFGDFLGKMKMDSMELVNLDTTALVAIVSGISNGGVGKLMSAPEAETRGRFKCNYKFVMDQAQSELQSPIFVQLRKAVDQKKCIICETVNSEFTEIVSMCGGPEEKTRASQLLKKLIIVSDNPSPRMMDLPTTRKLAMKNKVVFGTGDHWRAPTLTANMGFVRAVSQSGMPLLTIEHRPRALIGL